MTKRKHAAKPATALNPTAPVAQALSPNCLHLDTCDNPSAEKKAKISGHLDKTAVSAHTAAEGLDIDDIFKQARHKKNTPTQPPQVCVLSFRKSKLFHVLVDCTCIAFNIFLAQGSKAVTKTPRVVGSKDDLFGTGQPKQRRYLVANPFFACLSVCHCLSMCRRIVTSLP